MIKKTKINRDLLLVSILTLITILTWIGMGVYRSLTKREIPEVMEKQLLPLTPEIKTEAFDHLENRRKNLY